MPTPKVDPKWEDDKNIRVRATLVAGLPLLFLLVAAIFSFGFIKSCTSLGKYGVQDSFDPYSGINKGFVVKTNDLLQRLIAQGDPNMDAYNIDDLNRKYPALEFALPYESNGVATIEASDLRLVGIRPDMLENEDDIMFYHNSKLPQLLDKQKEQLSETFFRFKFRSGSHGKNGMRPLHIESIRVVAEMFKVALVKNPWTGVIEANDNSLFNDSCYIYVSYGNSFVPIRSGNSNSSGVALTIDIENGFFKKPVEYYDWYRKFENSDTTQRAVRVVFRNVYQQDPNENKVSRNLLSIRCVGKGNNRNIIVNSEYDYDMFGGGENAHGNKRQYAQQGGSTLERHATEGDKIVVYDENGNKQAEFTVHVQNPVRVLSRLMFTSSGKKRYSVPSSQTDLFTRQLVRGVDRNLSNTYNVDTVRLSVDPILSYEFEREIKDYLGEVKKRLRSKLPSCHKNNEYDISLTIMDMATGDVIASPYYVDRFANEDYPDELKLTTRNVSLVRRYIGSTFKPMLALAAVQSDSTLLSMNIKGHCNLLDGDMGNFFGRKTKVWAKNHWNNDCDFVNFLAHSDDVYPVALAAWAMTGWKYDGGTLRIDGDNNFFTTHRNGMLCFRNIENSNCPPPDYGSQPFTNWLTFLYSVNENSNVSRDSLLFKNLMNRLPETSSFGLDEVSPDVTNFYLSHNFGTGGDFSTSLRPWILGQGGNDWNCIKLAEAWSRMVSKRKVDATFVQGTGMSAVSMVDAAASKTDPCSRIGGSINSDYVNNVWNSFLGKFKAAQSKKVSGNTLLDMYDRVENICPGEFCLFSKTGTPDAYDHYESPLLGGGNRRYDIGMYTFALVKKNQYDNIRSNKPSKGIVCVVRLTRTYSCKHSKTKTCDMCKGKSGASGLWSFDARDLFSADGNRLRKLLDMTKNHF